jgi:hypothetical protein
MFLVGYIGAPPTITDFWAKEVAPNTNAKKATDKNFLVFIKSIF